MYRKIKYFCSIFLILFLGICLSCNKAPKIIQMEEIADFSLEEAVEDLSQEDVEEVILQYELPTEELVVTELPEKVQEEPERGQDGKININTADKDTLMTLYGIGAVRAEAIIVYRNTNGAFQSPEEIMKVYGIGEGIYRRIEGNITVK